MRVYLDDEIDVTDIFPDAVMIVDRGDYYDVFRSWRECYAELRWYDRLLK